MRTALAKALLPDPAWSCAAAVSAAGSVMTTVSDVASQLLGVPLPVVLGAIAGAFLARAYAPPTGFLSAAMASAIWTVAGCVLAPFAPSVAKVLLAKFAGVDGFDLPAAALAGVALCISLFGPLLLPPLILKVKTKYGIGGSQSGGQS